MVLFDVSNLQEWIEDFFVFFQAPLFTVGSITFSFWDVFIGGAKLSLIGFAVGKLIFAIQDD